MIEQNDIVANSVNQSVCLCVLSIFEYVVTMLKIVTYPLVMGCSYLICFVPHSLSSVDRTTIYR